MPLANFSKTVTEKTNTRICHTAGTGSGLITQGTPQTQLVFRKFSPQMERLCKAVTKELKKYVEQDPKVDCACVDPTNVEVLSYYDYKEICYRDPNYGKEGEFLQQKFKKKIQ